ncbi:MAG: RNA polymerase sigma-70 factor [Tannerella sp.]|nr:RNA polymerase sigma-70 factor [Tannerella sp.]
MMNRRVDYNTLILRVISQDDENAYYEIFNSFYAPLCIYAYRFIKDLQTREDCVQEVFLKLWKDRKKLRITTSIRAYLLTATKNHCLNYLHRKELETNFEQYLLQHYDEPIEELYSVSELKEMIDSAIAKLPEKYRIVFEMSRFDEISYKDIAEKMNISVKTVESYISKSLAILRDELKEYYIFLVLFFPTQFFFQIS